MEKPKIIRPSELLAKPFLMFAKLESSGGIVLILCTIIALFLANSSLQSAYEKLWHTQFTLTLGAFSLSEPLLLWINDGLMALFFLVVGLEIKREILEGELSSFRKAALPVAAAIGGMIIPALLYSVINIGQPTANGWGIPMATDIAFSLGVLTLLGRRIPIGLKSFLVALAIADDIGAVLVIALFYTSQISINALLFGAFVIIALIFVNLLGTRHPLPYFLLGILLWLAFLKSGIHATLAGVLLALLIPAHHKIDTKEFISKQQELLNKLEPSIQRKALSHYEYQQTMNQLSELNKHFEAPMHRLERILLPWVTFLIVPLFALANAGIDLSGNLFSSLKSPVTIGIFVGLILGKQLGITALSWLAVKTKIASLPSSISWKQIYGVSWLAGIGFTMSIFITNISLQGESNVVEAKIGILFASTIAGAIGYLLLRLTSTSSTS